MNHSVINWDKVDHFDPKIDVFPEDPDKYADPFLIYALDSFRKLVRCPIYPSPVEGALARFSGSETSRHYAVGRKSDAIDVFPDSNPRNYFLAAITSGLFGAVGFYPFTYYKNKDWPMLHLDLRPRSRHDFKPLIWFRDNDGGYHYPQSDLEASQELFFILAQY